MFSVPLIRFIADSRCGNGFWSIGFFEAAFIPTHAKRIPTAITPGRTSSLTLMPPIRMVTNIIAPMNIVLERLPTIMPRQTVKIGK